MIISGWGNYPKIESKLSCFEGIESLRQKVDTLDHLIVRGSGLSYGDSALNTNAISTLRFNRIREFDLKKGVIRAEAGIRLRDIIQQAIPRGWFLPVTPGTKHITLGGAIASDVHGKNHHKMGTFSNYIRSMDIMLADGRIVRCSRSENRELFRATCGGMGLTGIILTATMELKKIETAYIKQGYRRARDLNELLDLFELHKDVSYSIAWIDCLNTTADVGRGILIYGEHATVEDLDELTESRNPLFVHHKSTLHIPFMFPRFVLSPVLGRTFNRLFYQWKSSIVDPIIVDYDSFFYPLDGVHNWNRIYGVAGSTEYQLVLPRHTSKEGLKSILTRVARGRFPVFLAGVKLLGKQNDNLLSFPMDGYTLSLEFPIANGLFRFLNDLDKLVLEHGGRLYLSKDVRMSDEMFEASYQKLKIFRNIRRRLDSNTKFQSFQSNRLRI